MKSKFKNLNFGSVEVLSNEEQKKVQGGYSGFSLPVWCYRPGGKVRCDSI